MIALLLVAEQPALAAVRIQRADADPRPASRRPCSRECHEPVGQPGLGQDRLSSVNCGEHVPQRRVQRDVDHGQPGRRAQRRRPGPR